MTTPIENMTTATTQVTALYQEPTNKDLTLGTGTAPSLVKRVETHLASLSTAIKEANRGEPGDPGDNSTVPGITGVPGPAGEPGDPGPVGDPGNDSWGIPGYTGNPANPDPSTITVAVDNGLAAPTATVASNFRNVAIKFPNYKLTV